MEGAHYSIGHNRASKRRAWCFDRFPSCKSIYTLYWTRVVGSISGGQKKPIQALTRMEQAKTEEATKTETVIG